MDVKIDAVDISPWLNSTEEEIRDHFSGSLISKTLQDVAQKWDYSFSNYGFAVIIGHGLQSNDIDDLEGEMSSFFGLEKEKKMKYCYGSYGTMNGGYVTLFVLRLSVISHSVVYIGLVVIVLSTIIAADIVIVDAVPVSDIVSFVSTVDFVVIVILIAISNSLVDAAVRNRYCYFHCC